MLYFYFGFLVSLLVIFLVLFQEMVRWDYGVTFVTNCSRVTPILLDTWWCTRGRSLTPVHYVVKAAVRKFTWKTTCFAFTWKSWTL